MTEMDGGREELQQESVATGREQPLQAAVGTGREELLQAAVGTGREKLLQAAVAIGRRLCREAWFDAEGHCSWMGRQDIQDGLTARYSVRSAAVGPELYGGSAGIALFLNELHRLTGDPGFAATALGAIRRSVRYMQHQPTGASPLSFFAGHLGMLYAACRLADVNPAAGLEQEMAWLKERILQGMAEPHTVDVISGNAGAIPVLLGLAQRPGLEELGQVAAACGDELCREARWSGEMCWWESVRMSGKPDAPPGTGFSHGASGCGLALLLLYARTGSARYLRTARGAFAFEDSLYSAAAGNWIDTRFPYREEDGALKGTFQRGWCHGGPGIAIARMFAAALDPESAGVQRRMAEAGVRVAVAAMEARLALPQYDATLCHGITGLSEIVLMYGEWFDNAYRARAVAAALELVRRYGASGDWPSGVNAGGPNPSLMIGTAGIGYHFLRLCDPAGVPSVLSLTASPAAFQPA